MADVQLPTSIDISNDDYSIEISCTQEFYFPDDKSKPYTRLPNEVMLKFRVETQLVSSSNSADRATYQSTREEVLVPSSELFSLQCGDVVQKSLDITHVPFSLRGKNIKWVGIYLTSDCEGRIDKCDLDWKLLGNLQELVSEIVRYIGRTRDSHFLPLEKMCYELNIKKLVSQPASVVASWKNWSQNMWDKYYKFAFLKPMQYLRSRSMAKVLEKLRQREGEFDPEETCCICMEGLSENGGHRGRATTRLECSHVYHESCISGWFVVKTSCPCCRADAPYEVFLLPFVPRTKYINI